MAGAALALFVFVILPGCDVYDSRLLKLGSTDTSPDSGIPYITDCGDGQLDEDELCDTGIAAGEVGACPSDCPTEDPCARQVPAGEACQRSCVELHVVSAIDDDGCCPPGVGAAEDSDCGTCGDGITGPTETCEPAESCITQEVCGAIAPCLRGIFSGDPQRCTSRCVPDPIEVCQNSDGCCPSACDPGSDDDCSATCGNGIVEPENHETCEPDSSSSPCPASCDDGIPCTTDLTSGTAEQCNLTCAHVQITEAVSGDGCCPGGVTSLTDGDCIPVCGNLVIEVAAGETCDPCPGSCADQDACTTDQVSGSASQCTQVCTHTAITGTVNGDGCCPTGANNTTDSDCAPICGNNLKEGSEKCDPCPSSCNDSVACTADGSTGSAAACSLQCTHTTITSPSSGDTCCPSGANSLTDSDCPVVCGNGATEAGEECDGGGRCKSNCKLLPSSLVHRYSFGGTGTTALDSVGMANGTVMNTTLDGSGKLTVAGGSSNQYVNLPNGIISALTNITVEAWVTWQGGSTAHRVFDFGMNSAGEDATPSSGGGTDYFYLNPGNSQPTSELIVAMNFTDAVGDYATADNQVRVTPLLSSGTRHHIVVTFSDPGSGSTKTLRLYVDGTQLNSASLPASLSGTNNRLSNLDDRNVWIGRSNYSNATFAGSFEEFRIYNAALSATQVTTNYNAGPD